ncbi:hypothetical protein [Granulicoccus phenolivorans]|uniref:hypothetical protein n=1 Tax=Granulicoccus phenolivorans TaxID=266854 RepID=UPI0011AE9F41|nr:hypothetical protein [Granulicoccus phenolivorans]
MTMSQALPAEALNKLRRFVERSKRSSSVRFPVSFVRSQLDSATPPLARLVISGGVRLNMHLLLALMATRDPFEISEPPPASYFAQALALPNPDTAGARRVTDALTWLHDHEYIVRTRRPGKTAHIRLLHHGSANTGAGRYVAAPLALWNQGWILTLPARAVGIYLVLKEATGGNANKAATLPGTRKAQYGLSPDTWTRATHELEMAGLLTVKEVFAKASPTDEWEPKRRRLEYRLTDTVLDLGPSTLSRVS